MNRVQCPNCGRIVDRATRIGGTVRPPLPYDVAVCCRCAALLEFGDDMEIRLLSNEALMRLDEGHRDLLLKAKGEVDRMLRSC